MQNREKYSCRSDIHTLWHTYRRIKNGQVSHPRAQRCWLPPLPVYNLMCEHCALKQKDHCKLCVYTARPNSVTLPLSYWRSAWPSLLDNASVLTVLLAWSHPVSAGGLQNMGSGNQAEGFTLSLLIHQGLFCSVLLYKYGNSKQVLRATFQPACLGLLIQTAIWLAALINQASGVDRKYFQPAGWAIKSKTQQELLINSMKQSTEN